jgi:hypothetical protein
VNLPPFEFYLAELLRCVFDNSMRLFLVCWNFASPG